jgi:hypothetical protein
MYKKTEGKTDTITDIQIDRMIKDKVDSHSDEPKGGRTSISKMLDRQMNKSYKERNLN